MPIYQLQIANTYANIGVCIECGAGRGDVDGGGRGDVGGGGRGDVDWGGRAERVQMLGYLGISFNLCVPFITKTVVAFKQ